MKTILLGLSLIGAPQDPASHLKAEMAAARKAGIPVTSVEMTKFCVVPAVDDAGLEYKKLFALTEMRGLLDKRAPAPAGISDSFRKASARLYKKETPAEIKQGQAELKAIEPVFELARRAAAKPRCDFGWNSAGMGMNFPHVATLKALVRCLCYEATRRSAEGNGQAALADLSVAARTSAHLAEDPSQISTLVVIALNAIIDRTLHQVLKGHEHDRKFLAGARNIYALLPIPNLRRALYGELYEHLLFVEVAKDPGHAPSEITAMRAVVGSPALTKATPKEMRELQEQGAETIYGFRKLIAALPSDPADTSAIKASTARTWDQLKRDPSFKDPLVKESLDVSKFAKAIEKSVTTRRATEAYLKSLAADAH